MRRLPAYVTHEYVRLLALPCVPTTDPLATELPDVAPPLVLPGAPAAVRCNGGVLTPVAAGPPPAKELHRDKGAVAVSLVTLALCLAAGGLVAGPLFQQEPPPSSLDSRVAVVRRILSDVPLIDGHNDLPWNVRKFARGQLVGFNLTADLRHVEPWSRSAWSHTDLPRMRAGMLGAQFWSAYVPCGAQYLDAVQLTLEQIDLVKRIISLHPQHLVLATSTKGVLEAHRAGQIASLVGVEGGHSLGSSLAVLRTFYSLGARYLTLTHTCHTAWADCSVADAAGPDPPATAAAPAPTPTAGRRRRPGLTEFGRAVVREMNRLGMMVDLSHASVKTMKDALETSKAPVIFSHSSAYSICNSSRNVPDDVLRLLADNGGIVMVNFYTYFITCNSTANISDVIAHINHVREVAGIDHVGIGAGYDGINHTPTGLEDVSRYPYLLAELLSDPLWTEQDVKKLAGLNLLRVFREVEEVRDKWQLAAVTPAEDLIPAADLEGHTTCMYLAS
ncbi:dipeptidase 1-like [Schistocerca piceifrons]|uniref:dipeptidase 1-like n=1 Tax=Schistocerca piceifrons TaxID=274613 RepID=UPI001F5F0F38|nr:dipeptidase 1-like [Schistocerca piceifrons]